MRWRTGGRQPPRRTNGWLPARGSAQACCGLAHSLTAIAPLPVTPARLSSSDRDQGNVRTENRLRADDPWAAHLAPRLSPRSCYWRQAGHTSRNCDSCFVAATVLLERSVVRDQHVPLQAAREVRLTDQPQRPGAPERGLSAESPSKCPVPGTSTRRTRDWCRTTSRNGRWRTCRKRDRPPSRGCTECLATGTRP